MKNSHAKKRKIRKSGYMMNPKGALMQIVEMPIADIKPYARNPRKNEAAVEVVANSIKEFGFKVPIIIDGDGEIVAGHTRLKAAKRLGLESVPVIVADDLTPEQIRAFRLADNRASDLSEWDYSLLDQELEELDLDMSVFGFDGDIDLDGFFQDAPEKQAEPKEIICPNCGHRIEQ